MVTPRNVSAGKVTNGKNSVPSIRISQPKGGVQGPTTGGHTSNITSGPSVKGVRQY